MALHYGNKTITGLYYGTQPITRLYKGTQLVWSAGGIRDNFDVEGALNPAFWTDDGDGYDIGVQNGLCRIMLPDFLLVPAQITRARYTAAQHPADGYVEFGVGNPGSGNGLQTIVYRRATNTSANTAGVGVMLRNSDLSIVRRVGGNDTPMADCGSFQPGDRVRLTQQGNLHTVHCNGEFVGEWNDLAGTALNTANERTLTMQHRGHKDPFGPRRYSPSLDWIECT